jgi:subtilisin-like proprotein convertase family protein
MKYLINNQHKPRHFLATLSLGLSLLAGTSIASAAGHVNWGGPNNDYWSFDHEVSGNNDGLSLSKVSFKGHLLYHRMSLPVVRVFYDSRPDGSTCGPYADLLGGTLSPISWMGNAPLGQREFTTANGVHWYEIGIRDQIGSYDLYQVFYLSENGTIDAHIYSKGLQCVLNHIHYPNWRIDVDIDGAGNDVIEAAGSKKTTEFNLKVSDVANHAWRVKDTVTGTYVDVLPGFPDFFIPQDGNTTIPFESYANNTVFGRLYKKADSLGWTFGPNVQVPFNEGENIDNKDVVLWYEGFLPHIAPINAQEPSVWHSTGVRLTSSLGTTEPNSGTVTQSFTNTASMAIPAQGSGTPYPSTISVAGVNTGTVTKVKVELNSLTHSWASDLDIVLVGPGGQAVKLMSDVGGKTPIAGANLAFDGSSVTGLSASTQILSGTYLPTDASVGSADNFPAPAPASASTAGVNLGIFNGVNPNGDWKLYVLDDAAADLGTLAGGWKLSITSQ